MLEDLAKATDEPFSEARCRDETDACSLQRAESDGGEELGRTCRKHVNGSAVVVCLLRPYGVVDLLLEEFVTTELEGALHEVAGKSWSEAGRESTNALILDNLSKGTDHATVVCSWIKLNTSLYAACEGFVLVKRRLRRRWPVPRSIDVHIDRSKSTMCD